MSKSFKVIRWLGDEKELPGIGVVSYDDTKIMDATVADSYIEQKLAEEYKAVKQVKPK